MATPQEPSDNSHWDLSQPIRRDGHSYAGLAMNGGQALQGDFNTVKNYYHSTTRDESDSETPSSNASNNDTTTRRTHHPKFIVPRCSAPYFIGRSAQLSQLQSYLQTPTGDNLSRKIVVVVGTGGAGKTQFCLKFAETYQSNYWGVFWIDASSGIAADNSYAELGRIFGRGASAAAGKYWLSQKRKKWLVVLDNVDNDDADVLSLLPTGNFGHILITTRRQNLDIYGTSGTIRLTRMAPEEAIDLLLWSAYPGDDTTRSEAQHRSTACKIAERLDFLAIAVHQAGSAIRRKFYTLDAYLTLYLRQRGRLGSITRSETIDREELTATWEIPFERIERRDKSSHEDAAALIHIFAFLHHQGIYEWMLHLPCTRHRDVTSSAKKLPSILQHNTSDREALVVRVRGALNVLYDYSLIEFDSDSGYCYLHPVIRDWVVSRIRKNGSDEMMTYWLRCTSFFLASCASTEMVIPEGLSVNALVSHADSLLHSVKDFDPCLLHMPAESQQLENIAGIYERAGRWLAALEHLTPLIEYRSRTQGKLHNDTLRVKRSASICHWNLFDVATTAKLQNEIRQARWLSRPSFLDWVRPFTPDHTEYLVALSDLTQTCWLAGRQDLSRLSGEPAVARLIQRFGTDNTLTLDATFHLARTYRHIGMLDRAHEMLRFVYHKRRETLGMNHLDTLMAKNEVGMSWCGRGDKARLSLAEHMVKDVLKRRQVILGKEHAYTLWSVNDVAKVLFLRGRPQESISYLESIVPAVARTLGENHVGMRMTKGNLARAYAKCNRWENADRCLSEIISDIQQDDTDWIRCSVGHARIQIRLNKLSEAERTCQSILANMITRDASLVTKLRTLTWIDIFLRIRGLQQDAEATRKLNQRTTAGLLAEALKRQRDVTALEKVRREYPDLDENALDKDFEIT